MSLHYIEPDATYEVPSNFLASEWKASYDGILSFSEDIRSHIVWQMKLSHFLCLSIEDIDASNEFIREKGVCP